MRAVSGLAWLTKAALVLAAVGWAIEVPRMLGWALFTEQYLAGVLGLVLAILFLTQAMAQPRLLALWAPVGIIAAASCFYIAWIYPTVAIRMGLEPPDLVVATGIILLATLVGLRMAAGWGIVVVALIFLAYALFGAYLPGSFDPSYVTLKQLVVYMGGDPNAVLGTPIQVASTIVIPFIIFGRMLAAFGAGDFFTDFAAAFVGRYRGGRPRSRWWPPRSSAPSRAARSATWWARASSPFR